jgi:hypothetical protein
MQIERKALADKNARQAAKRKTKEAEQRHLQSVQALKQKAEEQMLHKRHLKARAKLLGSNNDGSPGFKKLILYAAHDANRYGTGL